MRPRQVEPEHVALRRRAIAFGFGLISLAIIGAVLIFGGPP